MKKKKEKKARLQEFRRSDLFLETRADRFRNPAQATIRLLQRKLGKLDGLDGFFQRILMVSALATPKQHGSSTEKKTSATE